MNFSSPSISAYQALSVVRAAEVRYRLNALTKSDPDAKERNAKLRKIHARHQDESPSHEDSPEPGDESEEFHIDTLA
ncbi:MAG: hypothetical protein J0L72_11590 [Armatimonadetes bacterium]|nr:hypothetical protein [Armatimonadota bacterium]